MSANTSEGRISMTLQSIMADSPATSPTGDPSHEILSPSAAPTPSSIASRPSPATATPTELPPARKHLVAVAVAESRSEAGDSPAPSQPPPDSSRRKRPLPEGRPGVGDSEPPEPTRRKRTLPEGRPDPAESETQSQLSGLSRRSCSLPEGPSARRSPESRPPERQTVDIRTPRGRLPSEAGSARSPTAPDTAAGATAVANRRRSHKVSRACDFCKAKKLKCSGTIPCDVCTKKRLTCIYDASYRRGRPPTPPRAPEQGFSGPMTETRMVTAVLPSDVPSYRDSLSIEAASSSSSAYRVVPRSARPESPPPPSGSEEGVQPTSRASPEVGIAEIEGQYFDTTSSLTFLHRAWKRLSSQRSGEGVVPQVPSGGEQNQNMTRAGDTPFACRPNECHPLPERAEGLRMLRFYFDVCVVTYRCLHQGSVDTWFNMLFSNARENVPLNRGLGHAKASIVMAILAIVALRQSRVNDAPVTLPGHEDDSELRRCDSYFCRSTSLTDMETGLPTLESAQARLLQVLYLLQTSRMNQAWYVFGSVLPIVSALGLHRKSGRKVAGQGTGPQTDYIVSQCRKRTFWVAYTIDKYLAVVFGRPRMYHDDDIDQDFPDCVNDEDMTPEGRSSDEPEMDCHVDALVFHARLAQLIDGISREVYSIKPVPKHERLTAARRYGRALHEWRESLPHHLGTVRPLSLIPSFRRQNTALKLAYCHAVMHANRPFLLGTTTPSPRGTDGRPTALESSVEECVGAARTALETVDGMVSDGKLFHAFWWMPYVTFCALAVVYVWKIQRQDAVAAAGDRGLFELADRCQNHLARATSPDSPNRRYAVILEELREEVMWKESSHHRTASASTAGRTGDSRRTSDPMQVDEPSGSGAGVAPPANMGEMFPTQGFEGMTNLLSGWETTDWLELDSSAFATFLNFEGSPAFWMLPSAP
ncbi:fungal specific transcription factor domain-containing protein [Colletotrichum sojae]|uniref:Fungal specific transcription factor domain-containing protein n=1 Tax=Colletotrichum sojae TaxID=2175907 RepID=A0A8H6J1U9_9PEZI|nr:fungal specific transcription factor domain-containing protein [Colletotrichum sojae]